MLPRASVVCWSNIHIPLTGDAKLLVTFPTSESEQTSWVLRHYSPTVIHPFLLIQSIWVPMWGFLIQSIWMLTWGPQYLFPKNTAGFSMCTFPTTEEMLSWPGYQFYNKLQEQIWLNIPLSFLGGSFKVIGTGNGFGHSDCGDLNMTCPPEPRVFKHLVSS